MPNLINLTFKFEHFKALEEESVHCFVETYVYLMLDDFLVIHNVSYETPTHLFLLLVWLPSKLSTLPILKINKN
jgi:hypothetical protein